MSHLYFHETLARQLKADVEQQAGTYARNHQKPLVDGDAQPGATALTRWRRGLRLVLTHG